MTVDNKENLIINIGGKTQCISKKDLTEQLEFIQEARRVYQEQGETPVNIEYETFCAKYNRDNEELTKAECKAFDPIVESVRADLLERSGRGLQKYGVMLSRKDIDLKGWLQHAYEEALDMANYLKRSIKELEKNEQ